MTARPISQAKNRNALVSRYSTVFHLPMVFETKLEELLKARGFEFNSSSVDIDKIQEYLDRFSDDHFYVMDIRYDLEDSSAEVYVHIRSHKTEKEIAAEAKKRWIQQEADRKRKEAAQAKQAERDRKEFERLAKKLGEANGN